jgi:CRP-like cAMP-binding protein
MAAPMTRAAIKEWLKAVSLFSELSADELDMLASTARSVTAKKHARMFEEGSPGDCCFVLTAGRARVVLSGAGDSEITLGTIKPKDLVGEIALLNRSTRSATLVAVENCQFIRIPAESFDRLRRNPQFEDRIISHITTTLRQANDQVRGIAPVSTMARVAWCLCRIARQEGAPDGAMSVIPRKTHQELAEMIGCARETVSRKLDTFRTKKCISWDRRTMRVDIEKLQRYLRSEQGSPVGWA